MSFDSFEYKTTSESADSVKAGAMNLDEAQGIVECFVAGIGNKDSVGDIVATGAFTKSLMRRKPRVVWGHNWNDPIGKVLEIYEVGANDRRLPLKMKMAGIGGLFAKVQFNLHSEKGREAFANVAFFGEEQEWSIGYKTLRAQYDQKSQANVIYELELYEVSPVLHGANQLTGTISVKADDPYAADPMQGPAPVVVKPRPEPQADMMTMVKMMESQLSEMLGMKVSIVEMDDENITYAKPGSNGGMQKFKCPYMRDGDRFMFGPPKPIMVAPMPVAPGAPMPPNDPQRIVRPQQMPSIPVAIKPHSTGVVMVPLPPVQYENQQPLPEADKNNLDKEEADLRDALLKIVKRHGRFNEDESGVWAGYKPAAQNYVAHIGVKCANCVFYKGGSNCQIIAMPVEPEGKCRFAVIPKGVVSGDITMKKQYDMESSADEESYIDDLEKKYPGELAVAAVRGVLKRKRKKNRKYKMLSEFGSDADTGEKAYVIPVLPNEAFSVKQALDPIFDYYRAESFVDTDGIVLTSGVSYELIEAVDTALQNTKKKVNLEEDVETKAVGYKLGRAARSIGGRLGDRPSIGGRRGRRGMDIDVPTGGVPGTRRPTNSNFDPDRDGWVDEGTTRPRFIGVPGEKPKPSARTRYGSGEEESDFRTMPQIGDPDPITPPIGRATPEDSEQFAVPMRSEDDRNPDYVTGPARRDSGRAKPIGIARPEDIPEFDTPMPNITDKKPDRHGLGLGEAVSRQERAKRDAFQQIADRWLDNGYGWVDKPRVRGDRSTSPDFLRGQELGTNQARLSWRGQRQLGLVRPRNLDENNKGSKDYENWYSGHVARMGKLLGALEKGANKENRRRMSEEEMKGMRNAVINNLIQNYPEINNREDARNMRDWVMANGFDESLASGGSGKPRDEMFKTPRRLGEPVPELDPYEEGFDPDNPSLMPDNQETFDIYEEILNQLYGEEPEADVDMLGDEVLPETQSNAVRLGRGTTQSERLSSGYQEYLNKPNSQRTLEERRDYDGAISATLSSGGSDIPEGTIIDEDSPQFTAIYDKLTEQVIASLEAALASADPSGWTPPWRSSSIPRNPRTNKNYIGGHNRIVMAMVSALRGYPTQKWASRKQWEERNRALRKLGKDQPSGLAFNEDEFIDILVPLVNEDGTKSGRFKTEKVINVAAVTGLPAEEYVNLPRNTDQQLDDVEQVADEIGFDLIDASYAAYNPGLDVIKMPPFADFDDAPTYYGTLFHEITHWTGHPTRNDRFNTQDKGETKGFQERYAYEELVAEIGASFAMAILGVEGEPREDHAQYLKHWLGQLRADPSLLRKAAKDSEDAINFLLLQSPRMREIFGVDDKFINGKRKEFLARKYPTQIPLMEGMEGGEPVRQPFKPKIIGPATLASGRDLRRAGVSKKALREDHVDFAVNLDVDERNLYDPTRKSRRSRDGRVFDFAGRLSSGADQLKVQRADGSETVKRIPPDVSYREQFDLSFDPSEQQRAIVDTMLGMLFGENKPGVLTISAGAGTGKTTTLKMAMKALDRFLDFGHLTTPEQRTKKKDTIQDTYPSFTENAMKAAGIDPKSRLSELNDADFEKVRAKMEDTRKRLKTFYIVFGARARNDAELAFPTSTTGVSTLSQMALWSVVLGQADKLVGGLHMRRKARLSMMEEKRGTRTSKPGEPPRMVMGFGGQLYPVTGGKETFWELGYQKHKDGFSVMRYLGLEDTTYTTADGVERKLTAQDLGNIINRALLNFANSGDTVPSAKHFASTKVQAEQVQDRLNKNDPVDPSDLSYDDPPQEWVDALLKFWNDVLAEDTPLLPSQTLIEKIWSLSDPDLRSDPGLISHASKVEANVPKDANVVQKVLKQAREMFGPNISVDDPEFLFAANGMGIDIGDLESKDGRNPYNGYVIVNARRTRGGQLLFSLAKPYGAKKGEPASGILVDESQDMGDVLLNVLKNNRDRIPIILVGDSRQAVMAWRGSKDIMEEIDRDYKLQLTESYRYGPLVAYLANHAQADGNLEDALFGTETFHHVVGLAAEVIKEEFNFSGMADEGEFIRRLQHIESKYQDQLMSLRDRKPEIFAEIPSDEYGFISLSAYASQLAESGDTTRTALRRALTEIRDEMVQDAFGYYVEAHQPVEAVITRTNKSLIDAAIDAATNATLHGSVKPGQAVTIAIPARKWEEMDGFFRHMAWVSLPPEKKVGRKPPRPSSVIGSADNPNIWDINWIRKQAMANQNATLGTLWRLLNTEFPRPGDGPGDKPRKIPAWLWSVMFSPTRKKLHKDAIWPVLLVKSRKKLNLSQKADHPTLDPDRDIEGPDLLEFSRRTGVGVAGRANLQASREARYDIIPDPDTSKRNRVYYELVLGPRPPGGKNDQRPGEWTGAVAITGKGMNGIRQVKDKDGNVIGSSAVGLYHDDIASIREQLIARGIIDRSEMKFKTDFSTVKEGEKNDAFVIEGKGRTPEEKADRTAYILRMVSAMIRNSAKKDKVDTVIGTSTTMKGEEFETVRVWGDFQRTGAPFNWDTASPGQRAQQIKFQVDGLLPEDTPTASNGKPKLKKDQRGVLQNVYGMSDTYIASIGIDKAREELAAKVEERLKKNIPTGPTVKGRENLHNVYVAVTRAMRGIDPGPSFTENYLDPSKPDFQERDQHITDGIQRFKDTNGQEGILPGAAKPDGWQPPAQVGFVSARPKVNTGPDIEIPTENPTDEAIDAIFGGGPDADSGGAAKPKRTRRASGDTATAKEKQIAGEETEPEDTGEDEVVDSSEYEPDEITNTDSDDPNDEETTDETTEGDEASDTLSSGAVVALAAKPVDAVNEQRASEIMQTLASGGNLDSRKFNETLSSLAVRARQLANNEERRTPYSVAEQNSRLISAARGDISDSDRSSMMSQYMRDLALGRTSPDEDSIIDAIIDDEELNQMMTTDERQLTDNRDVLGEPPTKTNRQMFRDEQAFVNDGPQIGDEDGRVELSPSEKQNKDAVTKRLGQLSNVNWADQTLRSSRTSSREKATARDVLASGGSVPQGRAARRTRMSLEESRERFGDYDYRADGAKYDPTKEQKDVSDAIMTGEDVIVMALAGTGKTSTLELTARRLATQQPDKKILYVVFNKKMQQEAERRFKDFGNIEVRTWHSVAYERIVGGNKKLKDKADTENPNILKVNQSKEIAERYGIPNYPKTKDSEGARARQVAWIAYKAMEQYAITTDKQISIKHVMAVSGGANLPPEAQQMALNVAKKMWNDSLDPDSDLQLPFENMMKKMFLDETDLSTGDGMLRNTDGNDVLFFDEAQDANPPITAMVMNQKMQKVIVGDSNQAIYAFRGSVDEIDKFQAPYKLTLTESFRFGRAIQGIANRFLSFKQRKHEKEGGIPNGAKLRVSGKGPEGRVLLTREELPEGILRKENRPLNKDGTRESVAILVNKNGTGFKEILALQDSGHTVASVMAFKKDLLDMIDHMRWLRLGKPEKGPRGRYAPLYEFDSWDELMAILAKQKPGEEPPIGANNVQALTALKIAQGFNFNFDLMEERVRQIVTADAGDLVDEEDLSKLSVDAGSEFELLEGAVKVAFTDSEMLVSSVNFDFWKEKAPIVKNMLGFRFDKTRKVWTKPATGEDSKRRLLTQLHNALRDGYRTVSESSPVISAKTYADIAPGSKSTIPNIVENGKVSLSVTRKPNGQMELVIVGQNSNDTFSIKHTFKASGFSWDGKSWKMTADSPEQAAAAMAEVRKRNGIADISAGDEADDAWVVRPHKSQEPDVVVQTAHRSKGLEYDTVIVGGDFATPDLGEGESDEVDPDGRDPLDAIEAEDLRLQYVTATRAKKTLVLGGLSWILDQTEEKDEEYIPQEGLASGGSSRRVGRATREVRQNVSRVQDRLASGGRSTATRNRGDGGPDTRIGGRFARRIEADRLASGGVSVDPVSIASIRSVPDEDTLPFAMRVWSDFRQRGVNLNTNGDGTKPADRPAKIQQGITNVGKEMRRIKEVKVGKVSQNNSNNPDQDTWMVSADRLREKIRVPTEWSVSRDKNDRGINTVVVSQTRAATPDELGRMLGLPDSEIAKLSDPDAGISHSDTRLLLSRIGRQPEFGQWSLYAKEDIPLADDEVAAGGAQTEALRMRDFSIFLENIGRSNMRDRFMIEAFGKDAYPYWFSLTERRPVSADEYATMTPQEKFLTIGSFSPDGIDLGSDEASMVGLPDDDSGLRTSRGGGANAGNTGRRVTGLEDLEYDETFTLEEDEMGGETGPAPQRPRTDALERIDFPVQKLLDYLGIEERRSGDNWMRTLSARMKEAFGLDDVGLNSTEAKMNWSRRGIPIGTVREMIRTGMIPDAESVWGEGSGTNSRINHTKQNISEAMNSFIMGLDTASAAIKKPSQRAKIIGYSDLDKVLPRAAAAKGKTWAKNRPDENLVGRSSMQSMVDRLNDALGTNFTIDDIFSDEQIRAAQERLRAGETSWSSK